MLEYIVFKHHVLYEKSHPKAALLISAN